VKNSGPSPGDFACSPREIRHRLSIYDTIERRALLAAQHAIGTAIDAHDDAIEAVYSKAYQPGAVEVTKYH
jgi:hypothetical protein